MCGRSKNGRFAAGNKFGTGRKVSELRKAFLEAVTPEMMQELVFSLVEQSKNGDVKAAELLIPYLIGKPLDNDDVRAERFIENDSFVSFTV